MGIQSWQIFAISLLAGTALAANSLLGQTPEPRSEPRRTEPIEPPHKPVQQGVRFAATIGLNLIGNGKYGYTTTVNLPSAVPLTYSGTQRSIGGTMSLGAAANFAGALRRVTFGLDLNFGGLEEWANPVIPPGTVTPFSQTNLNAQFARKSLIRSPWRPFLSPYIEHEIGGILQNRVRLGYEFMQMHGASSGSFFADNSTQAAYAVRFSRTSHMIRISAHNDTWFDDTDGNKSPPKKRHGLIQQGGALIGTDGGIVVFFNVGPVWIF